MDKNKNFTIIPKNKLDELSKLINIRFNENKKIINLLIKKKFNEFLTLYFSSLIKYIDDGNLSPSKVEEYLFFFNEYVFKNFKKTFDKGKLIKVNSSVNFKEGQFINNIIKKYKFKECIEVGMAFGISAMYITNALTKTKGHLISIDPFQSTQWKSMGMKLLKNSKLDKYQTLIEKKSYVALPELLEKHGEGSF